MGGHPQIAAFARLAKGSTPPTRAIWGQVAGLARGNHDVRYDPIHDEIFSPGSDAVLVFRGGASGQEAPLRILEGPKTRLGGQRLDVDLIHDELFVPARNKILVFRRDASGDVAPLRVIEGPDTRLREANAIAVDPVTNLIVVDGYDADKTRTPDVTQAPDVNLLFFKRTDSGNVKPQGELRIPNIGPRANPWGLPSNGGAPIGQLQTYPEKGWLIVTVPGADWKRKVDFTPFIGIWSIHDRGEVPPRWKLGGSKSTLLRPRGVALNPKNKEIIVSDMRQNAVLTFYFPEIF